MSSKTKGGKGTAKGSKDNRGGSWRREGKGLSQWCKDRRKQRRRRDSQMMREGKHEDLNTQRKTSDLWEYW